MQRPDRAAAEPLPEGIDGIAGAEARHGRLVLVVRREDERDGEPVPYYVPTLE